MEEVLEKLNEWKIKYELVKHSPVYTMEDMYNLETSIFKGAEICKNLFLRDQKGKRHFLVVLCSEKQANLSVIQEQANSTRLSFGSAERLDKYLKLEAGHVSPIGLINDQTDSVEVLFDIDLKNKELLSVHPNTNEASILITIEELEKFVKNTNHNIKYIKI